jgi:bifunctional DNase/RNase
MQIEMTIKGLMVDPITNMPIVILRDKDGQKVLPIWVGTFEANAIALQDNTFYALIYLAAGGDTVAIDARPSDAIALALRTRAPIFVEDTVIDHAKTVDLTSDKADADRLHKWLESLDPEDLGYKM